MVRISSAPEPYRVALRNCPPPLQDAFKVLREMVRRAAPHAQERAIAGWNGVTFCSERQGFLFYIRPLKGALNLGFYRGDLLSDPQHLLRGFSRTLRFVRIREERDVQSEALRQLLEEAVRVGGSRAGQPERS